MKQDIEIAEVKEVFVAAVHQFNEDFRQHEWNVYLINEHNFPLEQVLIVSKGEDEKNQTSTMRHSVKVLPAKSFAKVEFLQPEILKLNNKFSVSFFAEGKLLHKNFIFKKNSIHKTALTKIPLIPEKGILAE